METTSELIKRIRKELGLTQAKLAEQIGTKRVNVTKYELGTCNPPGSLLLKILELGGKDLS